MDGIWKEFLTRSSIVDFARRKLGFEPDGMQEKVLASRARRGILCCTRQWGKSTVTAAMAVHRAWSRPDSLILVASPGLRQSGEFLFKANELTRRLGMKTRGDGKNSRSLLFPNGSRIVGLPGTEATVRGFSAVTLLLIDEAARVPDRLYKALRPMLAHGQGDLWLMSTPFGQQGFFYDTWANGGARWQRFQVKATECSRIPEEFLEEERESQGDLWFRQEYLCEFHSTTNAVFTRQLIETAISEGFEPVTI
jgi:hypothetical protein